MSIKVEFFGIPRSRVGTSQTEVCVGESSASLGQVIAEVARKFPAFAESCTQDGQVLREGYIANVDGGRFVKCNGNQIVSSGQSVLILSADAGG